jgi:hypothetical protein
VDVEKPDGLTPPGFFLGRGAVFFARAFCCFFKETTTFKSF